MDSVHKCPVEKGEGHAGEERDGAKENKNPQRETNQISSRTDSNIYCILVVPTPSVAVVDFTYLLITYE